jgi:hypothetical protein
MALSKLDTEFLQGMLKAHEMEVAACQKFIQMADENSDRSVVDLAFRMVNKINEASDKIKSKLDAGGSDPRAAIASAMGDVSVMSNSAGDGEYDSED